MPRKRSIFIWRRGPNDAVIAWSAKLRRHMARRRMSSSDLARACWGEKEENGFFVPIGVDLINQFVHQKALPDPETLTLLAKALGVPESELATPKA